MDPREIIARYAASRFKGKITGSVAIPLIYLLVGLGLTVFSIWSAGYPKFLASADWFWPCACTAVVGSLSSLAILNHIELHYESDLAAHAGHWQGWHKAFGEIRAEFDDFIYRGRCLQNPGQFSNEKAFSDYKGEFEKMIMEGYRTRGPA